MPDFSVSRHQIESWVVVAVVGKDLLVVLGFVVMHLVTGRFMVKTMPQKMATSLSDYNGGAASCCRGDKRPEGRAGLGHKQRPAGRSWA